MTTPTERLEAETVARRENRELRLELEATSKALKELRKIAGFYEAARSEPIRVAEWRANPHPGHGHRVTVMSQCADWHIGEVVEPDEVLYLNAFNEKIVYQRIEKWFRKTVELPRTYVNGVTIEGLVVPATGDLFTGEIHEELTETNYERVLESVLNAQEPILSGLEMLGREYAGNVEVNAVVGNHGRLRDKPVFKGRVYDNLEWLFWSVVRDRLKDRGSSVIVNVSTSMDMNIEVYGRNYLLTHGDQFKGGTGISGAFAPLSLGAHRKGKRQDIAGVPMKRMVIGHMHQLINIPGVIMGGCLKGYDEYAFGLNLPPDPDGASQAMWITSPEREQVLWMPIYLQDREAEGW